MPQYRHLSAAAAIAAGSLVAFSSVAAAHPGHGFDNVWVDTEGVNEFEAAPGDRDLLIGLGGGDVILAGDRHDHVFGGGGADSIRGGGKTAKQVCAQHGPLTGDQLSRLGSFNNHCKYVLLRER